MRLYENKDTMGWSYNDPSGYGKASRDWFSIISSIDHHKYDFKIYNLSFERTMTVDNYPHKELIETYKIDDLYKWSSTNDYIACFHMTPHSVVNDPRMKQFLSAKVKIGITVWETTALPIEWITILNSMDAVVVPCSWNQEVFTKQIAPRVFYIPHVINVPSSTDIERQSFETKTSTDPFVILSMSQWTIRKGFDILIRAYLAEFALESDVVLVIKSYRSNTSIEEQTIIKHEITALRNSVFMNVIKIALLYLFYWSALK